MKWMLPLALAICCTVPAVAVELQAVITWDTDVYCDVFVRDDVKPYHATSIFDTACCATDVPIVEAVFSDNRATISDPVKGSGPITFTLSPLFDEKLAFEVQPHVADRSSATQVFPPTNVTIRIYLDGLLVKERTRFFAARPDFRQEIASYPTRPKFIFEQGELTASQKILIHKYRADDQTGFDGYYSPYQIPPASTLDPPRVRFRGLVEVDGAAAVRDTFLRVIDRPDTAPYVPSGAANDNLDSSPKGNLYAIDNTGARRDAIGGVLHVTSDMGGVTGRVEVVLESSDHVSGDNYALEASFAQDFPCATGGFWGEDICAKSMTVVNWRRVYVERDRMFRRGANITANVAAGAAEIFVADTGAFRRNDRVRIIHGRKFDETGSAEFYMEDRTVTAVRRRSIVLDQPVTRSYEVDRSGNALTGFDFPDAVGVINTNSPADVFDARIDYVVDLFASAFVEYVFLEEGPSGNARNRVPHVPHVATLQGNLEYWLAMKWSETRSGTNMLPNHQHLLGGSQTGAGHVLGETHLDQGSIGQSATPFSWVFAGRIESVAANDPLWSGMDVNRWNGETVVHELIHTYDVNPPTDATGGHCDMRAWDNSDECVMNYNVTRERANGIVRLHAWTDPRCEYRRIRTQTEPIPRIRQR